MMEGTADLDKVAKEADALREKYRKTDRSLKYVKNLIESYKKDRHTLQMKLKRANEEIEIIEKRLAVEKMQELNDFRQLKRAEIGLAIVDKRIRQLEELSEPGQIVLHRNSGVKTEENIFDEEMETELLSRIEKCKGKIDEIIHRKNSL